eukprot:jgi/Ulvmu1/10326/UM061_0009.1
MAQQVSTFCSRSKCKQPNVAFTKKEGATPSCTCTVTLFAHEVDGHAFPETVFTKTERNKKAAKAAAMIAAHDFLCQTEAYTKVMSSQQTAWSVFESALLTEKVSKLADIRSHVIMAQEHFQGWIPIAPLLGNAFVAKYCKKLGPTQYEQVAALAKELQSRPPPAGVTLSPCGLSLRLHTADAVDFARRLNPGFVEGGHGSAADALRVVIEHSGRPTPAADGSGEPGTLPAVLVPVDCTEAIREVQLPTVGHFRSCLAAALETQPERLVRVGTLDSRTTHRTLAAALADRDAAAATRAGAPAAAAEAATPHKRSRAPPAAAVAAQLDSPSERAASDTVCRSPGEAQPSCGSKRDASGSPVGAAAHGLHSLLKATVRCGDCYAALPAADSADPSINTRASLIAGSPVHGAMLITRIRISGLPPDPHAPEHNGVAVTVKPVMRVVWRGMTAADLGPSLAGRWQRSGRSPTSLLRRLPTVYEGPDSWFGPPPQQLLAKALQAIPGASITAGASSISLADPDAGPPTDARPPADARPPIAAAEAAPVDDGARPTQTFTFSMEVAALGSMLRAEGTAATAAAAREGAALRALHQLEQLTVCSLLGREVPPERLPEAAAAELEWTFAGGGPALRRGCTVKGEFTAAAVVEGREVMLEQGSLHGRVGVGAWVPAIEAALQRMRAGSIATLCTPLPFLGPDPSGTVERVPVTVRLQVAPHLPGQPPQKVFTPPLATQRHTLIREVVRSHECRSVVDFGCGEGAWITSLLLDAAASPVAEVAGVDESPSALRRGCKRVLAALVKRPLHEELRGRAAPCIQLLQGSVTQAALLGAAGWGRWHGCDGAVACEVVEHVHEPDVFARCLLQALRPRVAVVSTPNAEYNAVIRFCAPLCDADPLKPLGADGRPMRDRDHKFEWTRAEFQAWACGHAAAAGYAVAFHGVGCAMDHGKWQQDPANAGQDVGLATQVAVFVRQDNPDAAAAARDTALAAPAADLPDSALPAAPEGEVRAELVFDTRVLPTLGAEADTQALREAVAQQAAAGAGGLPDGVDAMLDGLQAFDLGDPDIND